MTLRYTHLSSDHKHSAVRTLERFGRESRQFSRQSGTFTVGKSHSLLKNNIAPLAQPDRASDF